MLLRYIIKICLIGIVRTSRRFPFKDTDLITEYCLSVMWFQEIYVMKMKISNFFKTPFFTITLTFIDDYTLNIDDIKEFWSFGLCWPLLAFLAFLAFVTLDESFKQKVANLVKNKQNWPVCINQMLKPIPNEIGHFNALWMTGTKAGP